MFKDKEMLLKQFFGLSPKQILFFTALNIDKHNIYKPFDFSSIFRLLKEYDSKITAKNFNKFINIMSISIKQYRLKSKELGNTKDKIKTTRLIEQFPIIDLSDDFYFIPSLNALIESLTYKLFKTLNDLQVKPQNFKREFGNTFENYTRRLTKFRHNEYIYECNELITEIKKEKAEYYLLKDNSTIVIESKLLPVNDEMILNGDLPHIKKNFIETINKAFSQIKSTFDHISVENKYAIIVIHTHTLLLESRIELLKDNINYEFIDNVIILSIIDYEILIDNSFEKIIEFFKQKKTDQKKHISIFFSNKQNMYLEKVFYSAFNEILDNN
ncbi:hypothetical protein [Halarcobacter ebronensis]|nr:hypothetical protein [Halarcobacter ebronensis]